MFKSILVPIDFSETAQRGLRVALGLARALGARLTLVHVINADVMATEVAAGGVPAIQRNLRERGEQLLDEARHLAGGEGVPASALLIDMAQERTEKLLLEQVDKAACDLIVMGTHGRAGVTRFVLGSTAELVARGSTVPVMLVPDPPPAR